MKLEKKLACFALFAAATTAAAGIIGTHQADAAAQYILQAKASGTLNNGREFGVSGSRSPSNNTYQGGIVLKNGRYTDFQGNVSCVNVSGTKAAVVAYDKQRGKTYTFWLEDNGTPNNGTDGAGYSTYTNDCNANSGNFTAPYLRSGEVTVYQP